MQDFYEAEYEGNVTEHLSYNCPACNDTGKVVGFSGRSVPCRYCNMHDFLLSQQPLQPDNLPEDGDSDYYDDHGTGK